MKQNSHKPTKTATLLIPIGIICLLFCTAQSPIIEDEIERKRIISELGESYGEVVFDIYKGVVRHSPAEHRKKLAGTKVEIIEADIPFGFYAGHIDENNAAVHITVGGVRTLDMVTLAPAIAAYQMEDKNWMMDYFMYVRGCVNRRDKVIADPMRAAGLTSDQLLKTTKEAHNNAFMSALTFIIAHEAAHVALLHDARQQPGESRTEWLARSRKQEAEADKYALEVLMRMKSAPAGAALAHTAHLLIYQRPSEDTGATHPADHKRIAMMADHALKNLDNYNLGPTPTEEARTAFINVKNMTDMITSGELQYADLDQLASKVTLESLRLK